MPILIGNGKREHDLAIRIYQLAKQLKVDNKILVDACKKLGIEGKGSALASLSDEQVVAIREHLGGARRPAAPVPPRMEPPKREEKPLGRVRALPPTIRPVSQPSAPEPPPAAEIAAPSEAPPPVTPTVPVTPTTSVTPTAPPPSETPETPAAPTGTPTAEQVSPPAAPASPPPETPIPATVTPTPPPRPAGAVRREDYIGPAAAADKRIPVLGSRPDKGAPVKKSPGEEGGRGSADKGGLSIKLAPMPAPKRPAAKKKEEPRAQKPDLRLPPGALRPGKAGGRPLSEQLRQHEKKRKAPAKKPIEAEPGAALSETGQGGKDRGKRSKRAAGPLGNAGSTLGGREQRQLKRKRSGAATTRRRAGDEEEISPRLARRLRRTGNVSTAAPRKHNVVVDLPCTVKSFAESLGLPVADVQRKLFEYEKLLRITDQLDLETAELLATALEIEVDFRKAASAEEKLMERLHNIKDDSASLKPRPPVVTFLGHVDHGKTSLLDRIINIDVVSTEKGRITQHIRAYRIKKDGRPIAFVDTPGHEAFTEMRARGANCTDIAVLVVAADDGVMPQTEEAISHARAAGVPIVVALNKIDLPGANPDRAYQQLAAAELLPSEWGGDVEVVRTSAITGAGIDELLDTILTVAELNEYKANPDAPGSGVCLEAEVQQGRGVVCKVLVDRGTLHVGDIVVCGAAHGRIKAMYDTLNPRRRVKEAGPSFPANLTGLDVAPGAGDRFYVVPTIPEARQIAEERAAHQRKEELRVTMPQVTLETLSERISQQQVRTLNIILRADVRGSIEAIKKEMTKLQHPEVQIKILQASVGGITEADVTLASASDAVIIGFNVVPEESARVLAENRGVQIRRYDIIYQITSDLKAALEGMLRPEKREAELGRALVQKTFAISRLGTIAGCRVLAGSIQRDARIRVIRESRIIGDYSLESLKREKDDAREVREGYECGMKLGGFNDLKEGDILEAYKIEEVARTF
ncbi:MAG: translation initiation factor IF-2 [Pirellulales bacterium]|nr:translation initiation factor IF-2 [Pirellulales bacterium]MDI9445592.1 translation initiation factor IF-2 [Planctomycetota bacterium]